MSRFDRWMGGWQRLALGRKLAEKCRKIWVEAIFCWEVGRKTWKSMKNREESYAHRGFSTWSFASKNVNHVDKG